VNSGKAVMDDFSQGEFVRRLVGFIKLEGFDVGYAGASGQVHNVSGGTLPTRNDFALQLKWNRQGCCLL
jgi:hypothetical protein